MNWKLYLFYSHELLHPVYFLGCACSLCVPFPCFHTWFPLVPPPLCLGMNLAIWEFYCISSIPIMNPMSYCIQSISWAVPAPYAFPFLAFTHDSQWFLLLFVLGWFLQFGSFLHFLCNYAPFRQHLERDQIGSSQRSVRFLVCPSWRCDALSVINCLLWFIQSAVKPFFNKTLVWLRGLLAWVLQFSVVSHLNFLKY